jgi:hypothetical protein
MGSLTLHCTINAEVTGRTTQIEVNADGTKTMLTGGTKTIYSWDADKGEITQVFQCRLPPFQIREPLH